jgi:putative endonuclease
MLVIVEVKTRSATIFGFPEESVNRQKQQHLKVAAEAYLLLNPEYKNVRFDIVSIVLKGDVVQETVHFESAFY